MDAHAVEALVAELEDALGDGTFSGVASVRHQDRQLLVRVQTLDELPLLLGIDPRKEP